MSDHAHKCPECGTIWRHTEECAGNASAHTCSQCGVEVWYRHFAHVDHLPIQTCAVSGIPSRSSVSREELADSLDILIRILDYGD